jgi:hypothetical protein
VYKPTPGSDSQYEFTALKLDGGKQESASSRFPCRCVVCRAHFRGEDLGNICPNLKVAGTRRVHSAGLIKTLTLGESKDIKAADKSKRRARAAASAAAVAAGLAPALATPGLAANPAAAAAAAVAAAFANEADVAGRAASSSSLSAASGGGGALAFARAYASADGAMLHQRGDVEFALAVSVPWQDGTEDDSDGE